jgi:hypothetical protein
MMLRQLIALIITIFLIVPAAADEYWVAQNPSNQKCKVVDVKPDGKMWIMIGTSSYPTHDAARAAKHASSECKKESKK